MTAPTAGLGPLIAGRQVCVCAGAGGVGKTTTAAAVAMAAAAGGAKVAVLTIDPARRLANALGLPELGNEERRVAPERFRAAGVEMRGELWAMMLDPKRTWDEVIERYAPDRATRDAVLGNRIYQELSNAVAGSQEFMAMEKLLALHADGHYDLLVLDTPPTRNALDFLDAPERLTRFVDSRTLQFFLSPSRVGLRLVTRSYGLAFSVLKRVTGLDLLHDLSEFFRSFGDMASGIGERARRVEALLEDERSTFLVITSPEGHAIEEADFFCRRLRERGLPLAGVIVNRMHSVGSGGDAPTDDPAELEPPLGPELAGKVKAAVADLRALAARDRRSVERLADALGAEPLVSVPHLADDVHDLAGLARVGAFLFPEGPAAASPVEATRSPLGDV